MLVLLTSGNGREIAINIDKIMGVYEEKKEYTQQWSYYIRLDDKSKVMIQETPRQVCDKINQICPQDLSGVFERNKRKLNIV